MPNIVKHSYIKGFKVTARAQAHLDYIQYRPGEDQTPAQPAPTDVRDQEAQQATNPNTREESDRSNDAKEYKGKARPLQVPARNGPVSPGWAVRNFREALADPEQRGRVVHKFVLSPSESNVDMSRYTAEVMESVCQSKGQDLRYCWVVHDNTDNRHAHVVILGKDEEGHAVRFDRHDYALIRTFGDRYLEREHGVEMNWNKDIEFYARTHGHNLYHESRENSFDWLRKPHEKSSWQMDEDFQHLLNINKNWAESLDGPGRESGLALGSTWWHDRGRLSQVHDLLQNTQSRDLWEDVQNNTTQQDLKEYATQQLSDLSDQRRTTIEELQKITGLSPEKFDVFINKIQEQFASENKELDQVLFPEKYQPQWHVSGAYEIDWDKIPAQDKIRLYNDEWISKYDSSEHLENTRQHLKGETPANWLPKERYSDLCSWIGTKLTAGEDYYGSPPLKERDKDGSERTEIGDRLDDSLDLEDLSHGLAINSKSLQDFLAPRQGQSPELDEIAQISEQNTISIEDALDARAPRDWDKWHNIEPADGHEIDFQEAREIHHSLTDTPVPAHELETTYDVFPEDPDIEYDFEGYDDWNRDPELEKEPDVDDFDAPLPGTDLEDGNHSEDVESILDIDSNGGEAYELDKVERHEEPLVESTEREHKREKDEQGR